MHSLPTEDEIESLVAETGSPDGNGTYVVRLTPADGDDREDVLGALGNGLDVLATSVEADATQGDTGDEPFDLLVASAFGPDALRTGLEAIHSVEAATVVEVSTEELPTDEEAAEATAERESGKPDDAQEGTETDPNDGGESPVDPPEDLFARLKATIDPVDTETLLSELEDVEFPGRDIEEEIDFDELLALGDSTDAELTRGETAESMTDDDETSDDEMAGDDGERGHRADENGDDGDASLELPLDTDEELDLDADGERELDLDGDGKRELDLDASEDGTLDLGVDDANSTPSPTSTTGDDPVVALVERLESDEVPDGVRERLREELGVTKSTSIEAQITHLQSRTSEFEAYLDALKDFLDENGTARELLSAVESELESLEERVDSLERAIEAERSERRDLADAVDRLETRLDERATADRVASLADEMETIDDAVTAVESDLGALADDVEENTEWREGVASAFAETDSGPDAEPGSDAS
ncbi:MAG TPA: hypothetical protein VJ898_03975 [Natrialbaceae archaeon]|nr:hypothetical protein [Natrialbaceae archaeon]